MPKYKTDPSKIRFECLADCSNCCQLSGGYVYLTEDEAAAIARYMETGEDLFLDWFVRWIDDQMALVDGPEEHCIFLEDGKCTIYPVRPKQCRTYPFWPENMKTKERWALTRQMCPGIGKGRLFSAEEISAILKGKDLDSER